MIELAKGIQVPQGTCETVDYSWLDSVLPDRNDPYERWSAAIDELPRLDDDRHYTVPDRMFRYTNTGIMAAVVDFWQDGHTEGVDEDTVVHDYGSVEEVVHAIDADASLAVACKVLNGLSLTFFPSPNSKFANSVLHRDLTMPFPTETRLERMRAALYALRVERGLLHQSINP